MEITHARKEKLREATRKGCIAMTNGMTKAQLQARLEEVKAKIKGSTGMDGKPVRGLAERLEACKEEAARLEGLIAARK